MKYQGSYCALITPFKDDNFDEESFIKIIEWHIKQGTQGIVPCGIKEHGVTSLVDLGLPISMTDLDIALSKAFSKVF